MFLPFLKYAGIEVWVKKIICNRNVIYAHDIHMNISKILNNENENVMKIIIKCNNENVLFHKGIPYYETYILHNHTNIFHYKFVYTHLSQKIIIEKKMEKQKVLPAIDVIQKGVP